MNEIQKYIAAHEPKMMDDLFSLIRIPSISALPEHHDDMLACAERWAQLLLEAGVDEALVMPSQGNPVVFAQKIVNPDAKTVLIYAHYDVMPAEPLELWKSEPFEPEIRDGHIWARGADDDKGQSFIQVKAFEYLLKNELLKNNVKFIFEGEEEIEQKRNCVHSRDSNLKQWKDQRFKIKSQSQIADAGKDKTPEINIRGFCFT